MRGSTDGRTGLRTFRAVTLRADPCRHDEGDAEKGQGIRDLPKRYEADEGRDRRFEAHECAECAGIEPAQRRQLERIGHHREQHRQTQTDQNQLRCQPGEDVRHRHNRGHNTGDRHRDRQAGKPVHLVTDLLREQDVCRPTHGGPERETRTRRIDLAVPGLRQQHDTAAGDQCPQPAGAACSGHRDAEGAEELQCTRGTQRNS